VPSILNFIKQASIVLSRDVKPEVIIRKASTQSESAEYGYWNLYPSQNKNKGKWIAKAQVKPKRKPYRALFSSVMSQTLEIQRELHSQQSKRAIKSRSHIPQTKKILKRMLKSYVTNAQIDKIKSSKVAENLFYERGGWFHDPLLFNINDCNMRHIRNMRARCSYLKSHSYFHDVSQSKRCPCCEKLETPEHFLLCCPKFDVHRKGLLKIIQSLFQSLDLEVSVQPLLGILPNLDRKKVEKSTRHIRRKFLDATLAFIEKSKRFELHSE